MGSTIFNSNFVYTFPAQTSDTNQPHFNSELNPFFSSGPLPNGSSPLSPSNLYNSDPTSSPAHNSSSDMPGSSPSSEPPSDFGFSGQRVAPASPSKPARARPSLRNPIFGNVTGAGKGNLPWGMPHVTLQYLSDFVLTQSFSAPNWEHHLPKPIASLSGLTRAYSRKITNIVQRVRIYDITKFLFFRSLLILYTV